MIKFFILAIQKKKIIAIAAREKRASLKKFLAFHFLSWENGG
jgi:hypothetical protein